MKKNNDRSVFWFLIQSGSVILGLLLFLAFITSLKTGISMFDPAILKMIGDIFKISLVILGILIFSMMFFAIKWGNTPVAPKSTLIKDNALRYEVKDGRRKYRKTFDLTNIDNYLMEYNEMIIFDDIRIYKQDKTKKSNALNLMVELPDKRKLSLRDLNNQDSDLYNRIGAFLDDIHNKDSIALSFHLRTYVNEEKIVHDGENTINDLKILKKKIKDSDIDEQIDLTISNIQKTRELIKQVGYSDKLRKLYEHYLSMLVEILDNYEMLERHKADEAQLKEAKDRLLQTFSLINGAITGLLENKEGEEFDELEAESKTAQEMLSSKSE